MSDPATNATPSSGAGGRDHQAELADVAGVLNVAHGRLIDIVADALATGAWHGDGIHTAAHWVAWQTGLSPTRAREVVRIAERRTDFPAVTGELDRGAR